MDSGDRAAGVRACVEEGGRMGAAARTGPTIARGGSTGTILARARGVIPRALCAIACAATAALFVPTAAEAPELSQQVGPPVVSPSPPSVTIERSIVRIPITTATTPAFRKSAAASRPRAVPDRQAAAPPARSVFARAAKAFVGNGRARPEPFPRVSRR